MDVNLIGGILGTSPHLFPLPYTVVMIGTDYGADTPELFWSEASLFPLYEAIREYLEIGPRVQVLNDRLAVVGDLVSAPPTFPASISERRRYRAMTNS